MLGSKGPGAGGSKVREYWGRERRGSLDLTWRPLQVRATRTRGGEGQGQTRVSAPPILGGPQRSGSVSGREHSARKCWGRSFNTRSLHPSPPWKKKNIWVLFAPRGSKVARELLLRGGQGLASPLTGSGGCGAGLAEQCGGSGGEQQQRDKQALPGHRD